VARNPGRRALARWVQLSAKLLTEVSGQDLVEYAFILALVVLVALASVKNLAASILTVLGGIGAHLTSVV
jgi:Flp pilus assembly pilin Flp